MICRVCLLDSTEHVEIFETEGVELKIASIISQHFWFEPKIDDPISNIMCNICWQKLHSFHIFYTTVEEAHRKLSERFCVKEDPDIKKEDSDNVQLETTVVDEDSQFFIKSEPDYFDNEGNQLDSLEPVYMECTKYEESICIEEPLKYELTDESHAHASVEEGTRRVLQLTRKEIFCLMKDALSTESADELARTIEKHMTLQLGFAYFMTEEVKKNFKYVMYKLRTLWKEARRKEEWFFNKNADWLSGQLILSEDGSSQSTAETKAIGGRPSTSFSDSSERSKRRKTEKLREDHSLEELSYATRMSLRASGRAYVSKIKM